MADEATPDNPSKTDWSMVSASISKYPSRSITPAPIRSTELAEANAINVPELKAPDGILSQFKANLIKRKAAMTALQTHYDSQLDVLTHTLAKAAQVEKSRADVMAEEYLNELDAKHLEVLAQLGMRNKQTRERALLELTDQTVARMRDVMAKDWPQELIEETISDLLALRKKVLAEILKELGSAYDD
jgi:hypothetical protein